jgi:hypothetical protein
VSDEDQFIKAVVDQVAQLRPPFQITLRHENSDAASIVWHGEGGIPWTPGSPSTYTGRLIAYAQNCANAMPVVLARLAAVTAELDAARKAFEELPIQIMNLPHRPGDGKPPMMYLIGHRDARHDAADLVTAALAAPAGEVKK